MKHIIKFNEAFLPADKEKAISIIVSYINKNSSIDLNPYDEVWYIQKENIFLKGELFLSLRSNKALRFNWLESDLKSDIHSIDIWLDFKFDINPDYTLQTYGISTSNYLPQILDFFKDPSSLVKTNENVEDDPKKQLEEAEKRLKRLRNPNSISQQKALIESLKATVALSERSETESQKVNVTDDLKIDTFKAIELYTIQVATGKSNSLIVTGQSGVGKTQVVLDALSSLGMVKDVHYYLAKGTATTPGLYEILFKNRSRLIVFDDCDDVFKDDGSLNILKAALDTYDVREISRLVRGYFDSMGMSDKEIQEKYDTTQKLPNRFEFTGQAIFISNKPEDSFDSALITRSLHEDVNLNRKELVDRMRDIMKRLTPSVDMDKKEEALEYLDYITSNYPTKFNLSIRSLIHSINIRANNENKISIGGKEEYIWKLLIKKYLIKK